MNFNHYLLHQLQFKLCLYHFVHICIKNSLNVHITNINQLFSPCVIDSKPIYGWLACRGSTSTNGKQPLPTNWRLLINNQNYWKIPLRLLKITKTGKHPCNYNKCNFYNKSKGISQNDYHLLRIWGNVPLIFMNS